MNTPLPTFDMMTGQQIVPGATKPNSLLPTTVPSADVAHVQLLDRIVVVPKAIVNGPTLRHVITSTSGSTPADQQAYLLFVTWKNFRPLLEYLSGNPVQLPSDKEDLLELKQTARKFNARDFERLVNRHLKQLYGGGCMGLFTTSQKRIAPSAGRKHAVQPMSLPMSPRAQRPAAPARTPLAPIKTQPAAKQSMFHKARQARHARADKAYEAKHNELYVAANAQERSPVVYDEQHPVIV